MYYKSSECLLEKDLQTLPVFSSRYVSFLAREYRKDPKDSTLFQFLTEQFLLKIYTIAKHYVYEHNAPLMEPGDLIEAGIKGLHLALVKFDSGKEVTLKTWVQYKVKNEMLTYIRNCRHTVYLPRINKGRKMPLYAPVIKIPLVSWSDRVDGGEYVVETSYSELEDMQSTHKFQQLECRLTVEQIIDTITEAECEIIYLYYWEELSQPEIGKRLGVSTATVFNRMKSAQEKMKKAI